MNFQTKIQLGDGKIGMGTYDSKDGKTLGIFFKELKKPIEIGKGYEKDNTTVNTLFLRVKNLESLEVLERTLADLRSKMELDFELEGK